MIFVHFLAFYCHDAICLYNTSSSRVCIVSCIVLPIPSLECCMVSHLSSLDRTVCLFVCAARLFSSSLSLLYELYDVPVFSTPSVSVLTVRCAFSSMDHVFMLRAIIEEGKHHSQKVYCCFVNFCKAFDSIPRLALF